MTPESEALLRHVQAFVHGRVPPEQENLVTELVARCVVLVMTTPQFLDQLTVVLQLRQENWQLRQALIGYQQAEMARARKAQARKATATKKSAAKKSAARAPAVKKAAPRKAPNRRSPNAAFKRGAAGR